MKIGEKNENNIVIDKNILIQYCDIREEVKDLEDRIDKLEQQKNKILTDSVKGSSTEFPYVEYNCIINGVTNKKSTRVVIYKKLLKDKHQELLDLQTEVEEYIQNLNNSRIRRIMRYRYIDNYSWTKIGHIMNSTAEAVRKENERFFQ